MEMVSRYSGQCSECNGRFPAGTVIDYTRAAPKRKKAKHVDCDSPEVGDPLPARAPRPHPSSRYYADSNPANVSHVARFSGGGSWYQNKQGRCEDAPCCGCCS